MAKGYRTRHDVSFPRVVARTGDGEGEWVGEGTNYPAGSIVPHDTLPPHIQKRIEEGDLEDTLEPMEDDEFDSEQNFSEAEPEFGIFVAEHEAEAHALREAGHHVIPKEQVLESLSAHQQHHADYQQAVKEHGLDRRPAQEHMAQAEGPHGRVPDHLLQGLETRTGLPHNRGQAQQERDEDYDEREEEGQDEEEPAARPRPGAENQQAEDQE